MASDADVLVPESIREPLRCSDAPACLIYSTRTGAADAPPSSAVAFEPDAALI
jgi:hypothetical protein